MKTNPSLNAGIPNGVHVDPLGVYGSLKGVYESPGVYKYSRGLLGVYDIFYVLKFYLYMHQMLSSATARIFARLLELLTKSQIK